MYFDHKFFGLKPSFTSILQIMRWQAVGASGKNNTERGHLIEKDEEGREEGTLGKNNAGQGLSDRRKQIIFVLRVQNRIQKHPAELQPAVSRVMESMQMNSRKESSLLQLQLFYVLIMNTFEELDDGDFESWTS